MLPSLAQSARRALTTASTVTPRGRAIIRSRTPTALARFSSPRQLQLNSRPYSTSPSDAPASPTGLDEGERAIYAKLRAAFPGKQLEVQDVSGGCGSFYSILISSPKFAGLSTIKQHKLVNACLKEDIQGIHGLQLKTIPEE